MRTGLGSGCGSCVGMASEIVDEVHSRPFPLPVFAAAA
jgi:bacterioferritin-associated ferredoxin